MGLTGKCMIKFKLHLLVTRNWKEPNIFFHANYPTHKKYLLMSFEHREGGEGGRLIRICLEESLDKDRRARVNDSNTRR